MARIARKDYSSAYFHVIIQGYEKQYIFGKDSFKEKFLNLLFQEISKFQVTLLAYCIMGNHAHLLLHTESTVQMSLLMKNINSKFATYYNKVNKRVGYVFRDRFKSEPIINQRYLYTCLSYIHRNPVKAQIVRNMDEYRYSSYSNFLNKNGIVNDKVLFLIFGFSEEYLELFNFIHSKDADGFMDYQEDYPKVTDDEAKAIINEIFVSYDIDGVKLSDLKTVKILVGEFLHLRISKRQIEKFAKINRKKIAKVLEEEK